MTNTGERKQGTSGRNGRANRRRWSAAAADRRHVAEAIWREECDEEAGTSAQRPRFADEDEAIAFQQTGGVIAFGF